MNAMCSVWTGWVAVAAFLTTGWFATTAQAALVTFEVNSGFTVGSGYGHDANEGTGTLLDVRFAGVTGETFSLLAGQSHTYNWGMVSFFESNGSGGIKAAETDNLGVTATFTFVQPGGEIDAFSVTGTATAGAINGGAENGIVDYTVTFDYGPTLFNFGNGGQFELNVPSQAISFSFTGSPAGSLSATVRLLSEPTPIVVTDLDTASVPEPASLAIWGLGSLGLVLAVRIRRRLSA